MLTFEVEDNPQANTPYLYTATNDNMTALNVSIAMDGAGQFSQSGWNIQGTYGKAQFNAADEVYAVYGGALYKNTGTLVMEPFRAYFTCDGGSGAKSFDIEIETPTGIKHITSEELNSGIAIYNVAGQQVGNDYEGIIIQNGKKYINK